jgi:hypothetical protein
MAMPLILADDMARSVEIIDCVAGAERTGDVPTLSESTLCSSSSAAGSWEWRNSKEPPKRAPRTLTMSDWEMMSTIGYGTRAPGAGVAAGAGVGVGVGCCCWGRDEDDDDVDEDDDVDDDDDDCCCCCECGDGAGAGAMAPSSSSVTGGMT